MGKNLKFFLNPGAFPYKNNFFLGGGGE